MDLLKIAPAVYLSSETDPAAIRCMRYGWPGTTEVGDVRTLHVEQIQRLLEDYPNLRILLIVGGSPCKGLSSSNRAGQGLANKHSKLFFDFVRIIEECQAVLNLQVEFIFENVASTKPHDRQIMSQLLGCQPVFVCGSLVSHCRRPRLFWVSFWNYVAWPWEITEKGAFWHLEIPGGPGPVSRWKKPGVS